MMIRQILASSATYKLLKLFFLRYCRGEEKFLQIFCESRTYKSFNGSWAILKAYSRDSFLGRATEMAPVDTAAAERSRTLRFLADGYQAWNKSFYLSRFSRSLQRLPKAAFLRSLPLFCIMVMVAILANVGLVLAWQKTIAIWGWVFRITLLLLAGIVLWAGLDWPDIISSSMLFSRARRR